MNQLDPYQQPHPDHAPAPQSAGTKALQNLEAQAQAMGNAMRIAEAMCSTDMVPKQFKNKPADGAAAILYGAELGLNAIQSLQQIMVINGKPGIETRTAVSLLKDHGYEVRTVESTPESVTVEGIGPRGEHEISTWTMQRAHTAGYTSNSLYKKIPEQMLYAKAAMEVARKIAPHVLSGIAYSTEELQLDRVNMTATRTGQAERGSEGVRAVLAARKPEPAPAAEPEAEQGSPFTGAVAEIEAAKAQDDLGPIMNRYQNELAAEEYQDLVEVANQRWNALGGELDG